jgi:hypothetical protein
MLRHRFVPLSVLVVLIAATRSVAAQGRPSDAEMARMVAAREKAAVGAREKIAEGNRVWGQARVSLDRATMERMLMPDAYVEENGMHHSRKEFLDQISAPIPGVKLKRFDATVLTVTPDSGGRWSAVIQEKMEMQRTTPDGKTQSRYFLWITRDVWQQVGDRWMVASSIAIGNEGWSVLPPIPGW